MMDDTSRPRTKEPTDGFEDLCRKCLHPRLKCTVSPGGEKEEKLVAAVHRLNGPGLVIAPDEESAAHIAEVLDSAALSSACITLNDEPDEIPLRIASCLSRSVSMLVSDRLSRENLPLFSFGFLVQWILPLSLREYVTDLSHLVLGERDTFDLTLFNPADRYYHEECIARSGTAVSRDRREEMYRDLDTMEEFALSSRCRIQFIQESLGLAEKPGACGNCDNCRKKSAEQSLAGIDSEISRTLLKCVAETREKFGVTILTDIVRGAFSRRIREFNLTRAATFGSLHTRSRREIKELFAHLISLGCLNRTTGTFPTLYLTTLGRKLLGTTPVQTLELPKRMRKTDGEKIDAAVIEELRNFRRRQAKLLNIPAFMVFSDGVLKEIAAQRPKTEKELMKIKGFGKAKWILCGEGLLRVVRRYEAGMNSPRERIPARGNRYR